MTLLTRDQILEAEDFEFEDVEVPAWGGTVRVRALSGAERDHFEGSIVEQRGKKTRFNMANLRARLVALAVIDDKGKRLFSNKDVEALGKKNANALNSVFEVAQRLAGLKDEDLEELTENFPDDPNAGSISN